MHSPASITLTNKVVIVGAGACGLTAALAARDAGADVLVLEREAAPFGTTSMSIGFIPAPGSKSQRAAGVEDSPENLTHDILTKNRGQTDREMVLHLARQAAPTVDWLHDVHRVPITFVANSYYPGHTTYRMHGTPNRTGVELITALVSACVRSGVKITTGTRITDVVTAGNVVQAVRSADAEFGCDALILASGGYAANRDLIAKFIPEIVDATFFGHAGSTGDAVSWGEQLGAKVADLTGYQSFGGLAYQRRIPVPWAHILRGGFQVNANGVRFSGESRNYPERALDILAQPGRFAWSIFDQRIRDSMQEFETFRALERDGGVISAANPDELCQKTGLPPQLKQTLAEVEAYAAGKPDPLGRDFTETPPLSPPYAAVKVEGALYHTQGGLVVDHDARVIGVDGQPLPNLFAGGGAARGLSGPGSWGYLAGNGLLSAVTLGRLAGRTAANLGPIGA